MTPTPTKSSPKPSRLEWAERGVLAALALRPMTRSEISSYANLPGEYRKADKLAALILDLIAAGKLEPCPVKVAGPSWYAAKHGPISGYRLATKGTP